MSSPTTSQHAAIEALKFGDESVQKMKNEYDYRRKIIYEGFREIGFECFEPKGAFYIFPSIKSTGLSSEDFCEKLLYQKQVAVIPGEAFGKTGNGFIRCSYASSMDNIKEAIKRIKAFVEKL